MDLFEMPTKENQNDAICLVYLFCTQGDRPIQLDPHPAAACFT